MKRLALFAVSGLVVAMVAVVFAAPPDGLSQRFGRPGVSASRGQKYGPRQAERIALNRYGGRLYSSAKLIKYKGRWCYDVILKSNGRLREVIVGANSGKVESTWLKRTAKKKYVPKKPARRRR